MKRPLPPERIALVGPGAVGSALARALHETQHRVEVVIGRHPHGAPSAALPPGVRLSDSFEAVSSEVTCIILAVPDDAIASVAGRLKTAPMRPGETVVMHTSGARSSEDLEILLPEGALLASAHPLQTFLRDDTASDPFRNTYVSLEGMPAAVERAAQVFKACGALTFRINRIDKVRLHAAAAIVSNYFVTLADVARQLVSDIADEDIDLRVLMPLIRRTVSNLEEQEPSLALTGPIARGDYGTVEDHLVALAGSPRILELYKTLALETVQLARRAGHISEAVSERFTSIIDRA